MDKISKGVFTVDTANLKRINTSTAYSHLRFFKKGARTGLTDGVYNLIEPVVKIEIPGGKTRTTSEHCIIGRASAPGPFSKNGDSGSWIMDEECRLVGLLWGGSNSVAYFTPIGLVLADIEARIGWRVELP